METKTQNTVLGGIIKHRSDGKMVIVVGEPGEGKTITFISGPLVGLEAFVELLYTGYTPAIT